MKAIVLHQPGGPEKLVWSELPTPQPKRNEVLVKISHAAVNHLDFWVRQGNPAYSVTLPHILGADGAGVVEALGPEAEGVSVGDRVTILPALSCGQCTFCLKDQDNQCVNFEILGAKRHGTYAEYAAVPDCNVMPIPDSLSFEEAAAFPLSYLTAWHMVLGRAQLKPKETIVVMGAGSGVGVAAIQIAQWKGAQVYGITSHAEKANELKSLGAHETFTGDLAKLPAWVLERTEGRGADVVFEHVGPATWEASMKSVSKYGRIVTCGATTGPTVNLELRSLFGRDVSILGARMGTQKEFQELARVVFRGGIKPKIYQVFPMEQAQQAHAAMEEQKQLGKILLKIT